MKTLALVVALTIVSGSAFAQQGKYVQYDPKTQTPAAATTAPSTTATAPVAQQPAAPSVDVQALAQQKLAEWQNSKRSCYTAAGLAEGTDFRQRPDNPSVFQVNDRVWLNQGNRYDLNKLKACR